MCDRQGNKLGNLHLVTLQWELSTLPKYQYMYMQDPLLVKKQNRTFLIDEKVYFKAKAARNHWEFSVFAHYKAKYEDSRQIWVF